jgi:hypothetical protein
MNTVYLVQESDYENTWTYCACLEQSTAESIAIQTMRNDTNINKLEVITLKIDHLDLTRKPVIVATFERDPPERHLLTAWEVGPNIFKLNARTLTPEELEEQSRKRIDPNRPDWLNPSSSRSTKPESRLSNGFSTQTRKKN